MVGDAVGDSARTGVVGRRIGAFFLDMLLAVVVTVLLGLAVADHTDFAGAVRDHPCSVHQSSDGGSVLSCAAFSYHDGVTAEDGSYVILDLLPAFAIATAVGLVLYVLVPLVAGGATAGKLVTGIRVQRLDGARPRFGPLLVRWLFLLIDGVFTLCICGLVTMLKTEDEQRVGDMAAGTVVVRRRES
jgi:uncharacterized RDD family membrane protein YckC